MPETKPAVGSPEGTSTKGAAHAGTIFTHEMYVDGARRIIRSMINRSEAEGRKPLRNTPELLTELDKLRDLVKLRRLDREFVDPNDHRKGTIGEVIENLEGRIEKSHMAESLSYAQAIS